MSSLKWNKNWRQNESCKIQSKTTLWESEKQFNSKNINFLADVLNAGEKLYYGQYLLSANGCFKANIGTDGNFVVYRISNGAAMWASNAQGFSIIYFTFIQSTKGQNMAVVEI